MKKIAIAVGGTGGHIIPAQEIGKELQADCSVIYVGVDLSQNAFFKGASERFFDIEGAPKSFGVRRLIVDNFKGFRQSCKILKEERITLVIGMGSYHSFPVIAAAAYLGIPYKLIELNVIPGQTNAIFSRWAQETLVHFEPSIAWVRGKARMVALRYRPEKLKNTQANDRKRFGFAIDVPVIFVFGGSSGAKGIDEIFLDSLQAEDKIQVIHVTRDVEKVRTRYKVLRIRAFVAQFIDDIEAAWNACDFSVTRSGGGAIKAMILHERPAILVPYPHAVRNHQEVNAKFICEEIGGGKFFRQQELNPTSFRATIFSFLEEKELEKMRASLVKYKKSHNYPEVGAAIQGSL